MPTKKVITIGSLTFDIFVRPLRQEILTNKENKELLGFPFGEKIRVSDVHECFGGGGANTAIGMRRLGVDAQVIGAVGNDQWGEVVIQNLKQEKVYSTAIQKVDEKTGFSVILNSFEGERTVLAYSGANHAVESINPQILEQIDGVHLCHLAGKAKSVFQIVHDFFIQNPDKFLSWNPGKEQIEQGLKAFQKFLPVIDVIILNREEAEEFSGVKAQKGSKFGADIYDMKAVIREFYKQGLVGKIVITDGRRGAQCADGQELHYCPIAQNFKRQDTLGAGDAFCSGFCAGMLLEKTLQNCLIYGTINASNVVSQFGAQAGLLTLRSLEKKKAKLALQKQRI